MRSNPNQNPNQRLYQPNMPNQLNQPMSQQLGRFYEHNNLQGNNPGPANLGPIMPEFGNFHTAFGPVKPILFNGDAKSMFNNHGFVNRNDLLHNDLNDNILNEEIRHYSILVDSKDRNYEVYPNCFKYTITFNPLPTTRTKVKGKIVVYETPNPVIYQSFCNVRYISLETVILPFFTKIKHVKEIVDTETKTVPKINTLKNLTEYLYIILAIEECSTNNRHSSNDILSESFATIYFDSAINNTHYLGRVSNAIKVFQPDELGTINTLKIKFMNPYGEELEIDHFDKDIKSTSNCTCDEDNDIINKDCFHHNIYHALHPAFQHHLQFGIGVVEPRLSKKIFT